LLDDGCCCCCCRVGTCTPKTPCLGSQNFRFLN
jgi:hypothetical protein